MKIRINSAKLAGTMAAKDITVNELVESSTLSRATVSGIRSGKACTLETAQKIAKALGVSTEWLTSKDEPIWKEAAQ